MNSYTSFSTWLRQRVDNSPLVLFRWTFGLLLLLESGGAIATGWVKKNFIEPEYHFPFIGFEWLHPLPGNGMYFYYALMAVLGFLVMIGFYYRASLGAFTLLWWGSYLMQKTSYNNHYYLLILLCGLMLLVPAHAYLSWDAKHRPQVRSLTCPRWCLLLFVAQMTIVYTYAAIAKLYPDWLAGIPIRIWFSNKEHFWLIGPLLQQAWFQTLVVYGGILFDLLIAPLMLWSRTRKYALLTAVFFHGFNSAVFHIGIFPYLALTTALFFFPPETIRRVFLRRKPVAPVELTPAPLLPRERFFFGLLGLYLVVQVLLPLRHWWFKGNVHWTEEGHRMAWHMMLRTKSGVVQFEVVADGTTFWESPQQHLTPKQAHTIATRPDMIWQYSQYLAKQYHAQGYRRVAVYAHTQVSLNGRAYQPLVDSSVNLASVPWQPFRHSSWLLPLKE